jgi:hypothetical protein
VAAAAGITRSAAAQKTRGLFQASRRSKISMRRRPNQAMAYFVLSGTAIFSVFYVEYLLRAAEQAQAGWFGLGLLTFKTSVEIVASFYGFAFLFGSIFYLVMKQPSRETSRQAFHPSVGILYLCCDDLDTEALESLVGLRYENALHLIIHDDSKSNATRELVDAIA